MQAPRPAQSEPERSKQLEDENRQLQRQVEQARFKNKRLKKRIERLEQDLKPAGPSIVRPRRFPKGNRWRNPKRLAAKAAANMGCDPSGPFHHEWM